MVLKLLVHTVFLVLDRVAESMRSCILSHHMPMPAIGVVNIDADEYRLELENNDTVCLLDSYTHTNGAKMSRHFLQTKEIGQNLHSCCDRLNQIYKEATADG